jgi:hemerythrin-like domain-containing protein
MALLHNAILRGFNSIYLQAPHVKVEDYTAFVGYSLTWYRFVKSHHDDEEAELFPKVDDILKEDGIWNETHQEHGIYDICSTGVSTTLTNSRVVP